MSADTHEPNQPQSVSTDQAQRSVVAVSTAVGLSIQGDSLLYGILPLAAPSLGISAPLVGLLLSANRLVRLFSNSAAAALFERMGPRMPFLAATILGSVTALLYGAGWGVGLFLLARLGWGIAWSGLRQGAYQAVWAGGSSRTGRMMGLMWGIVRAGSAISVVVGGRIWDLYGYRPAVLAIAAITLLAIPIAWKIRWPATTHGHSSSETKQTGWSLVVQGGRVALRDPEKRWLLLMGFVKLLLDSVLVSTASLFLAQRLGGDDLLLRIGIGVGTAAGVVLAIRWVSDLIAGPLLGALSDRTGQITLALYLIGILHIGLAGAAFSTGLTSLAYLALSLIVSTGVNVTLDAAANRTALRSARPHLFVGLYTTVSDLGSAVGPLFAYSVASAFGLAPVYLALAVLTALVVIRLRVLVG